MSNLDGSFGFPGSSFLFRFHIENELVRNNLWLDSGIFKIVCQNVEFQELVITYCPMPNLRLNSPVQD